MKKRIIILLTFFLMVLFSFGIYLMQSNVLYIKILGIFIIVFSITSLIVFMMNINKKFKAIAGEIATWLGIVYFLILILSLLWLALASGFGII